jgi:hypothetical protein
MNYLFGDCSWKSKHGMKDEVEWISRRIDFINNSPVEII